jgi:NADP-dependent 3-hydroxy acid dehydrogenase YdfG
VANAGVASYGSVLQVDPEAVKRVLDVNLLGVFHTVRATLPALIERRGYLLVVSSLAAFASARRTCPGSTPRSFATPRPTCPRSANCLRRCPGH